MSSTPRVDSMKPRRAAPTRTAPPRMPDKFWSRGRYLPYVLFGACGAFLMAQSILVLQVVWTLGAHDPAAWEGLLRDYASPGYLVYHAVALVALVWFGLRLIRLFPKTQPPRLGPVARPPLALLRAALYGGFAVVSAGLLVVLWGVVP